MPGGCDGERCADGGLQGRPLLVGAGAAARRRRGGAAGGGGGGGRGGRQCGSLRCADPRPPGPGRGRPRCRGGGPRGQHPQRRLSRPPGLVQVRRHGAEVRAGTRGPGLPRGDRRTRLRGLPDRDGADRLLLPQHRALHRGAVQARVRRARAGPRHDAGRRRAGGRRDGGAGGGAAGLPQRALSRRPDPARQRHDPRGPLPCGAAGAGGAGRRARHRLLPGAGDRAGRAAPSA